jgi:hypothetical protein
MLAAILFTILLYQRINIARILSLKSEQEIIKSTRRANVGLLLLGILASIQIGTNFVLERSLWEADFISHYFRR